MGDKSGIEWTDATWNPVTGCTKVSQGCKHCYAERIWKRPYPNRAFTDVQCHPDRLGQPMRWSKPRRIFVNSMSDLFHEAVPFEFIAAIFAIMGVTTRHTYQILTKRPERMLEFFRWCADESEDWMKPPTGDGWQDQPDAMFIKHSPYLSGTGPYNNLLPWKGYDNCGPVYPYENVWLGVSVENQETADERIPLLLQTPGAVRWISAEPLLGPVELRDWLYGPAPAIDWVVAGGESGPKARPSHPDWFRGIRDQCLQPGVPFHFKQWGQWAPARRGAESHLMKVDGTLVTKEQATQTRKIDDYRSMDEDFIDRGHPGWARVRRVNKKLAGRTLDGETWDQYPE